jgi:hypothetical protein
VLAFDVLEDRMVPANFLVTSNEDQAPPLPHSPPLLVLRDAIAQANASGDPSNSITFAGSGGITIATPLPPIAANISIDGAGNGGGISILRSAAPGTPAFRIFTVTNGSDFNLSNIGIYNGSETDGGGILVESGAGASLYNVVLTDNGALSRGGAIFNAGILTVENSLISANIARNSAAMVPTGSGGGIFNQGTAFVQWSTMIQYCHADAAGGGIFNDSGGTMHIDNSTIKQNDTAGNGGGISNRGQLDMNGGTLLLNWASGNGGGGGGIECAAGTATLISVDIASNQARSPNASGSGGGFLVAIGATLTLDGCSLEGNDADNHASDGGRVLIGGTLNADPWMSDLEDDIQDDNP